MDSFDAAIESPLDKKIHLNAPNSLKSSNTTQT
jgi:hypothetical protein